MTYDTRSHDTHASPFFSNPWDQPMGFFPSYDARPRAWYGNRVLGRRAVEPLTEKTEWRSNERSEPVIKGRAEEATPPMSITMARCSTEEHGHHLAGLRRL